MAGASPVRHLLTMRADVRRLAEEAVDGQPVWNWKRVARKQRCRVDLTFIRRGVDPIWTPEAGRPADRQGVLFIEPDSPMRSGDRITIVKGPRNLLGMQFELQSSDQPVSDLVNATHREVGLEEVARQTQDPRPVNPRS